MSKLGTLKQVALHLWPKPKADMPSLHAILKSAQGDLLTVEGKAKAVASKVLPGALGAAFNSGVCAASTAMAYAGGGPLWAKLALGMVPAAFALGIYGAIKGWREGAKEDDGPFPYLGALMGGFYGGTVGALTGAAEGPLVVGLTKALSLLPVLSGIPPVALGAGIGVALYAAVRLLGRRHADG